MKQLITIFTLVLTNLSFGQDWQTISMAQGHGFPPINQFAINPYTNQLWFAHPLIAAVIENDGEVIKFGEDELGTLWQSDELRFGFTPDHLFFSKRLTGLHLFDGYTKQLAYYDEEITTLRTDGDTLFMRRALGPNLQYIYQFFVQEPSFGGSDWITKNGHWYSKGVSYAYVVNETNQFLYNNNDYYLLAPTTTFQFQNYTDTIYLGFTKGISKAHAGECFDTITPFNTTNMPSGNVLEIEFDKNDDLWVAFGDEDDKAIALGKLTGNEWTEIYDANNSPINFNSFHGFEFDTLGNLWVASGNELHTLLTPNSPSWLSTKEWTQEKVSIVVYPNPASDFITVNLSEFKATDVKIINLQGSVIQSFDEINNGAQLSVENLPKGIYMLELMQKEQPVQVRFVKQ